MKKFYTTLLSTLLLTGPVYARLPDEVAVARHAHIDYSALGELKPIESFKVQKPVIAEKLGVEAADMQTPTRAKAPAKAPSLTDITAQTYECTYYGMMSNNSGTHTGDATFTYYEDYEELNLTLPDCNLADIYCEYDASEGTLIFPKISYGNYGGNYLLLVPLTGTAVTTSMTATYDEATKSFVFPDGGGLAFAAADTNGSILGYYWAAGDITLTVPDGDYSLNIGMSDECSPDNKFTFTVTAGADIAKIMAILFPADMKASEVSQYFPILGQEIVPGTYSFEPAVEVTSPYSVLLAAYDADGTLRKTTEGHVIVILDEPDQWQTIATLPYEDGIVTTYYNNFSHLNETTELQESLATPGVFRYVNPYAGAPYIHNEDCNHYLTIDAQDPEFVTIPYSPSGMDLGDGILAFGSFGGAMGYTKEECEENGYSNGTKSGRTLAFPARTILVTEYLYNGPGSWSYGNSDAVTFTLPDLTLEVTVLDNADMPLEGVSLTVEGLAATTDADGKASFTLPDEVDYLATTTLTATLEGKFSTTDDIKLNGAANKYVLKTDIASGIESVVAGESSPVEYFNLQGVRVDHPAKGELVIKRQGNSVSKTVIR